MSDANHNESKRPGSSIDCSPSPKKLKESDNVNEKEEEEYSEDDVSAEELQLSLPFELPDLTLRIGGRTINLRKEHLALGSPVFDRMLNSDFKEIKQREISLPGKKFGQFVRFLRYILPGFTDRLEENTVHDMLPLAEEYQTEALKQRIDIFLAECVEENGDKISSEEIVNNLLEAELYKLSIYLSQCTQVAARKMSRNLMACEGYQDISESTKLQIFNIRCSVFEAILQSGKRYNFGDSRRLHMQYDNSDICKADSIHIGMVKNDGEMLEAYLQDN